jgi:hypothetical protein
MITRPSCSDLLDAIRVELETTIRPAVSDPKVQGVLAMLDSMLVGLTRRFDHEVAWMREEITGIEDAALAVIDGGADSEGKVAEALDALRAGRSPDLHVPSLQREYDLAGEVLSRALEAGFIAGGDARARVERELHARLDREVQIRGEFALVGRE